MHSFCSKLNGGLVRKNLLCVYKQPKVMRFYEPFYKLGKGLGHWSFNIQETRLDCNVHFIYKIDFQILIWGQVKKDLLIITGIYESSFQRQGLFFNCVYSSLITLVPVYSLSDASFSYVVCISVLSILSILLSLLFGFLSLFHFALLSVPIHFPGASHTPWHFSHTYLQERDMNRPSKFLTF